MPPEIAYRADAGDRLDAWLAARHKYISRSRWQDLIREGNVTVNGLVKKPNYSLREGDSVTFTIPEAKPVEILPEDIPLDVLYEDADMIIINKQAGLVVHPAPGHDDGTLVNALLHHCKDLKGIGGEIRPGLVHRLDKDTSGVLVVGKHEQALLSLANQFKTRKVEKEYVALVWGIPRKKTGTIRTLIARDPKDRKKMSVDVKEGRDALTRYAVVETYRRAALVRVRIETGRTHQIRVHMLHIGNQIVGDRVYGRSRNNDPEFKPARQMLHAAHLKLTHPVTGAAMDIEAPLPADFHACIDYFRKRVAG